MKWSFKLGRRRVVGTVSRVVRVFGALKKITIYTRNVCKGVPDLLVLLLKVVDALLLVGNGLLSLPDLFLVPLS